MQAMSSSRPPLQPKRSSIDSDDLDDYDAVITRMRRMFGAEEGSPEEHFDVGEYFGALLNSPPLCAIASRMGTFVRTAGERGGTYSHADREFVDQVLSADLKTNVVQLVHLPDAIAAGVRLEAIEAFRYHTEEVLTDEEQLLTMFIRQAVSGTVTDDTWNAMVDRLGVRGVVEYTGFILWLQWILRMMQMLGISEPSDEDVDRMIGEFRDGARPIPNFRERLE
jgi:hypothetical protein